MLTNRLQILLRDYPSAIESYEPLLLYANIFGQATVIYFCRTMMDTVADSNGLVHENPETLNYKTRALEASSVIIQLASTSCELPYFKVSSRPYHYSNNPTC